MVQIAILILSKFEMNSVTIALTANIWSYFRLFQVLYWSFFFLNLTNQECLFLQAQRNGFVGPTIGPKPVEKNLRFFTDEQIKASHSIIGLQAGYNKGASQKGMSFGATRHGNDIKSDDMTREGQAIISLQSRLQ